MQIPSVILPIDRHDLPNEFAGIEAEIRSTGFSYRTGAEMAAGLRAAGQTSDWDAFVGSWDDLGLDLYMADGGRYRRRRFAAFGVSPDGIVRKPHQPHYQSRDYNPLNGDIERWFDPVLPAVAADTFLQNLFGLCYRVFASSVLRPVESEAWHAEMHQFRIEATPDEEGRPTPEGMHRDGVDWVCVMLIRRENVRSGTTEIFDEKSSAVNRFTLTAPLDTVFLDDARVRHGVTPISRLDDGKAGFRDVLVLTFRGEAPSRTLGEG